MERENCALTNLDHVALSGTYRQLDSADPFIVTRSFHEGPRAVCANGGKNGFVTKKSWVVHNN